MVIDLPVQRFACTQCGLCCNRSPEVELSETAALADVFVFSLMFRLYTVPNAVKDDPELRAGGVTGSEAFYQQKRLLNAFAARKSPVRLRSEGKPVPGTQYLAISALALDAGSGACRALRDRRCTIYDQRPLGCRAVPFHHSRAEASLEGYLREFAGTPGYACDTSDAAPAVIQGGKLVDAASVAVRGEAVALAERERPWKEAIVRQMKAGFPGLPSLRQVEDNARFGATTTSLRLAWQIAAEAGLMSRAECRSLVARQLATTERELAAASSADLRETLVAMRDEYRAALTIA